MITPTVPVVLPGLNHRLTPEQLLVNNWQRFHETLDTMSVDHVLNVLVIGPKELVEYIHFVMGGKP